MGRVAPNPMVGGVLVHDGMIIGEGFHQQFGHAHAEVNAIADAEKRNESIPENTVLYVNLEPCNHHEKTPPCTELIISKGIKKVVVGTMDPHYKVKGKGIERLRQAGIEVTVNVCEKECHELNKTFFTYLEKQRPYIILKWAQSIDCYISSSNIDLTSKRDIISNDYSRKLTHKWRSESMAIMVGTNTAKHDNPQLNVRDWSGNNPIRITLDRGLILPNDLHLFDGTVKTIIFTEKDMPSSNNLEYIKIDFNKDTIIQLLDELYKHNIQSLFVEGGASLINSFMDAIYWDEARIFIGNKTLCDGIKAPEIRGTYTNKDIIEDDILLVYKNH